MLNDIIQWLDSLKPVFGDNTISGYTNNKVVNEKYQFRLYPEGNHYISMYVVFYQTMLKAVELEEIMKHTEKQGFIYDGINRFADPNVFKLTRGKDGRSDTQKVRHALSDKIATINDKDPKYQCNKVKHGVLLYNAKPSNHIIQVRSDERII